MTLPAASTSLRSMTGYGRSEVQLPSTAHRLVVEITTVNRRTLDVAISSPREWNGLETRINEWLGGAFIRGRVQISIKLETAGAEANSNLIATDHALLSANLQAIKGFAESECIPFKPDAHFLLELAQTLQEMRTLPAWNDIAAPIQSTIRKAATAAVGMREHEGIALERDLRDRLEQLQGLIAEIETISPQVIPEYHSRLLERLAKLKLELDLTDDRVLKEVALLADRIDISEELTRLKSHLAQFNQFLTPSEPAIGRKMDFLCQEINRELNTIGSKTSSVDITRRVIDCKNLLEQIREQVQNIE